MLTQLAAYSRDAWDADKAQQLLNNAIAKLQKIPGTSPRSTRLRAEIEEIAGDLEAQVGRDAEYGLALSSFKSINGTRLDQARLHRKIGALEIARGDVPRASRDIKEARTLLEGVPGAIDERANLDDLSARELEQQGKNGLAVQALQEAVMFDRQSLADAKSKAKPFLRLTVALAAHLEHLGDELRRSGQESAGQTYDEAEKLASEVLQTYPNQISTRFMIDLIRHGNRLLDDTGSPKVSRETRTTHKEAAIDAAFGDGFGRFKFGMTPAQVNELAGNPYDISQLPRAFEYSTDDVRYFTRLVSEIPDFQTFYQSASCLRDHPPSYRDSQQRQDSDYATFLFHENALFRISIRFFGQTQPGCPDRSNVLPELAEGYGIPVLGTQGQWRLSWDTSHTSLFGSTSSDGAMVDFDWR
jgi:tetratricopeptide (TPR) repeat protein